MRHLLLIDERHLRLMHVPGEPGEHRFVELVRPADAAAALVEFRGDPGAMTALRQLLAEAHPTLAPHHLADDVVVTHAADLLATGRAELAHVGRQRKTVVESEQPDGPPPGPTPAPRKKLTWIEIRVVADATGEPIPWVRMRVTLPTGDKDYHTTDKDGLIRIDDIEPGTCDANCDLENAKLADSFAFVRLETESAPPPLAKAGGDNTTKRIILLDEHQVRTGETLEALAQDAGITASQLAKFNWGTDAPAEVNKHLRDDVGCTKKDAADNYLLDDSDRPGIIFIPQVWLAEGLETGRTHVVRVRRPSLPQYAWLAVQVFFHGTPIEGLAVEYLKSGDDDGPGESLGPALTTDKEGLARREGKVPCGNYICRIERQADALITTVSDEKAVIPLALPIGRPLYEFDAAAASAHKQQEIGPRTAPEA
jgi:hypothetical protein